MKVLSRNEMKNINGGKQFVVNCTMGPGYSIGAPGTCEGSISQCQTAANNWCAATYACFGCTLGPAQAA